MVPPLDASQLTLDAMPAQVPGLPIAVLLDYDGTISLRDVGDDLMARFVADQDAVAAMDARYVAGEVGSRALMAWDMEMLPDDPALLRAAAATVPQDEGLVDLVALCRARGVAAEVVSDGLGFYAESNLARLGIEGLPVYTNRNLATGGGGRQLPFGHPLPRVRHLQARAGPRPPAAGRVVVFVGDGPSDRYAAWHADVTFAKGSLERWCRSAGVETQPWERLADVTRWLRRPS
ncbi:MAG: haloacid dehalogenase-like hydrolase [Chloroflexota bacterium]